MAHHVIEFDSECQSCDATGLYVGMGERSGAAVVCVYCKGTGKRHHRVEYDDFVDRRPRNNVKRVFQCNPGIAIGENDTIRLADFGGLDHTVWAAGEPFTDGTEMRRFTCPAWWYQTADYAQKPNWDECEWGRFSECQHFPDKAQCWARWDREHGNT